MGKAIDETGNRYGKLVVLERNENNKYGSAQFLCQCDCGNQTIVSGGNLRKGTTKSCGCSYAINEKTNRYGKLVVLKRTTNKGSTAAFLCRCDCGKESIVRGADLRNGHTKSCGCGCIRQGDNNHNWTGHKEINGTYWAQSRRGAEKRNLDFNITIEQAWQLFLDQDRRCALSGIELEFATYTSKEEQTASLDRIDSSKGYTLDNIQWVHKRINELKWNLTEEELLYWCQKITENKLCLQ